MSSSPRFIGRSRAFTIVELLVVISIIALLVGILLPAISKARDSAKVTESLANLRNMASAHQSYAAEWNDRQFTLNRDDIGAYPSEQAYEDAVGDLPPLILGYGYNPTTGDWTYVYMASGPGGPPVFVWPIRPDASPFGWFRMPNVRNFNQYVNSRFYDRTFYAPKDKVVIETIGEFFDLPGEFAFDSTPIKSFWSSYCLSPAALFAPKVFNYKDCDLHAQGQDSMGAGAFRTPAMSQARFPSLKTHMIEHHWLQNNRGLRCNPLVEDSDFDGGCEPYYFNATMDSAPCSMFFDGSVRIMSCREVGAADQGLRVQGQTTFDEPTNAGLYFRPGDVGFAEAAQMTTEGYFLGITYDGADAASSSSTGGYAIGHHILTKDGILGRDTTGGN
jgi:prepilin-type N-terminal cleavage/methylation domain-containing protein